MLNFTMDQIATNSYRQLSEELLKIAPNRKIKEKLKKIIYNGGFDDFSVNTGFMNRNNLDEERKKRIAMARILLTNPETFEYLKNNKVNLFHGTNANALPGILKYGMRSVDALSELGEEVLTGEEWSRIGGKRDFISFTDNIDLAFEYALMDVNKRKGAFNIILGISTNNLKNLKTTVVCSDIPEIGICDAVPLDYIQMIGVPEEYVGFVKKLIGDKQIEIMPMNFKNKGYYIDDFGKIYYKQEELKKLTQSRKQSGIKHIFNKFKEKIVGKDEKISNDECTRDE